MKVIILALLFCFSLHYSHAQWVNIGQVTGTGANYPTISVVSDSIVWIAGGTGGVAALYRSTNGGTNFLPVSTPAGFELTCLFAKSVNECFVGDGGSSGALGGNAKLYMTTNAGVNWTIVNQTGGTSGFFNDIVFSKVNPMDGVAVSNPPAGSSQAFYVLKTTDGGINWVNENPAGVSGASGIWHCAVIYDAGAYGFGISNGFFPRVYGTTDAGANWAVFPVLISAGAITSFAYSDISAVAIASSSSVVARTSDQGVSWQTVNTGGANSVKWIPGTGTCYFLSNTGNAIKKSTDDGLTWNSMTVAGVSGLKHFDFAVTSGGIYGYGISSTGIVIKLTDNITGINFVNENVPQQFMLYQNYPNPFNPSTKIKFDVPTPLNPSEGEKFGTNVTMSVFDITGRQVVVLVDEQLNPGTYEVNFDAGKLSSGAYFYKLVAGDYTSSKKMLLVK